MNEPILCSADPVDVSNVSTMSFLWQLVTWPRGEWSMGNTLSPQLTARAQWLRGGWTLHAMTHTHGKSKQEEAVTGYKSSQTGARGDATGFF